MRSAIANPKIVDEHGDVVTNTKLGRELKRLGSASRPASVHKVRIMVPDVGELTG